MAEVAAEYHPRVTVAPLLWPASSCCCPRPRTGWAPPPSSWRPGAP